MHSCILIMIALSSSVDSDGVAYFMWLVYVEKPLCEAHHGRHAGAQSREALLAALLECHASRSFHRVG